MHLLRSNDFIKIILHFSFFFIITILSDVLDVLIFKLSYSNFVWTFGKFAHKKDICTSLARASFGMIYLVTAMSLTFAISEETYSMKNLHVSLCSILWFMLQSFGIGWVVGSWPLFWALFISFILGTAYSINVSLPSFFLAKFIASLLVFLKISCPSDNNISLQSFIPLFLFQRCIKLPLSIGRKMQRNPFFIILDMWF